MATTIKLRRDLAATWASKNPIPAAGEPIDGSVFDSGDVGIVWSSVLNTNDVNEGQELHFVSEDAVLGSGGTFRFSGVSVRGVIG